MLSKPPFNVPATVVDARERFLKPMKALKDAEEKRKMFRETFYQVLAETAKKEKCKILVQGTIRADIIETVGAKTQHNVLEQMGINPMERFSFKVVEPLLPLFKEQVRMGSKDCWVCRLNSLNGNPSQAQACQCVLSAKFAATS